ncbi:MAG: hypothetical protein Q8881_04410, partial [Sweet potato little leaf phytoplasma]|nr:hypothetical protein [Sweet potato little leaf phytoplasma]
DDSPETTEFPPNFALGDVSDETAESITLNFRHISHSRTFLTKRLNFCRISHSGTFPLKRPNFALGIVSPETAEFLSYFALGTFPRNGRMNPDEFIPNFALGDVYNETAEFPPNFALGDVSPETAEFPPNFALGDVSDETAEFPPNFALVDTLLIRIALSLSSVILVASSFGFIGIGLDNSIPEW